MLNLIVFLIFITATVLLYLVFSLVFIKNKSIERLDKYLKPIKEIDNSEKDPHKYKEFKFRKLLNGFGGTISETVLMKKYMKEVKVELIKSGLPLKGEEFLSIQMICFMLVSAFVYYPTKSISITLVLGSAGWFFPRIILDIRKRNRYKLFNEQLGDGITLISNSLKAGYSFIQAVDSVATEMPSPISDEFKKLIKELQLGSDTEKALNNLLQRVESDDLELVITAVIIQREIGGNLSEILDSISNTIRERIKLKGEIRTLTAQGRISGIVVGLLPIGLGIVMYFINPEYISTLFKNQYGLIMLGVSMVNQLIGTIIINKIVKIEV